MSINLYDASNIDHYHWPETEEGRKGRAYLYPLIKEGTASFLDNVSSKMFLVTGRDFFLPFSVNEKEYDNSYVASNYYAINYCKELLLKKSPRLLPFLRPVLFLAGLILKLFKVNKAIFLNNWLMTNSLSPSIHETDMEQILGCLKQKFPSHIIFFRHIDAFTKQDLLNTLKHTHFDLLKTRNIFIYNPANKFHEVAEIRKTYRRDMRLIAKYNYEIVRNDQIQESDFATMLALYEKLYLDKYTAYSPKYTEKFLKNAHEKKILHFVVLKKEGVIEGFFAYFIFYNSMINAVFGYDTSLPHSHEIYKILARLTLEEAEKNGLVINEGSGADQAKLNRGLKPYPEYLGIYGAHLPWPRRLILQAITALGKKLAS